MKFCSVFIVVLGFSTTCLSIDKGPEIVRICLDNNTSIATVYWQSTVDNCNSFKDYTIYTSENNGPWIKSAVIPIFLTNNWGIALSDVSSSWKFRLTTHSACNGLDSFVSKDQSIDQNKPPILELDSVSFDQQTQKLIAGWKKNSDPDTKAYRLYNFSNSVFSKIMDTASTLSLLNGYDKNNQSKIALATYDSCNQFSPISSTHRPVYLIAKLDSCKKTISLSWNTYEGWSTINQYLILNKNYTGFTQNSILSNNGTSYVINNITLGDNLCYYIRSEDVASKFTSSSNIVCFKTVLPKEPKFNYINNVTVIDNTKLGITYASDAFADTDSLLLEKSVDGLNFNPISTFKFTSSNSSGFILDSLVNVNSTAYTYRIHTISQCLRTISVSNNGKSILLSNKSISKTINELNWNLYKDWELGIEGQFMESCLDGFTWKPFKTFPNQIMRSTIGEETSISDSLCFRINNYGVKNNQGVFYTSVSNMKCLYPISDFYLPGTINPYSQNNTFSLHGKGIDYNSGQMEIFNRWGEKIFVSSDVLKGWDGKINDTIALQGSYIYKVSFFDLQNNYHLKTGTFFIIR